MIVAYDLPWLHALQKANIYIRFIILRVNVPVFYYRVLLLTCNIRVNVYVKMCYIGLL